MVTIFLVGKSSFVSDYLNNLKGNKFSLVPFLNFDEALKSLEKYNPKIIILIGNEEQTNLLNFCKKIREEYSFVLPILLIVDFYSSVDLNLFRNLGVEFIVKPFSQEEFNEKIESLLYEKGKTTKSIYEKESEIIDKIRPYIRQEVKSEMLSILKQIVEGMKQNHV